VFGREVEVSSSNRRAPACPRQMRTLTDPTNQHCAEWAGERLDAVSLLVEMVLGFLAGLFAPNWRRADDGSQGAQESRAARRSRKRMQRAKRHS
jgi:hypothetical protein